MSFLCKLGIYNKKDFLSFVTQFIKFGVVGLSNTAISLAIYYIFIYINKNLYLLGNTVGFVISVVNAYYWNNKYVFEKSQKGHAKPLIKTFMAYGITFALSTVMLFVMVRFIGISEKIAPLINLVVTIPLNFLLNKFWALK